MLTGTWVSRATGLASFTPSEVHSSIREWDEASPALFRGSFGGTCKVRQTTDEQEALPATSMDSKTHVLLSGYFHSASAWPQGAISRHENSRWFYWDLNASVGLPTRGKPGRRNSFVFVFFFLMWVSHPGHGPGDRHQMVVTGGGSVTPHQTRASPRLGTQAQNSKSHKSEKLQS